MFDYGRKKKDKPVQRQTAAQRRSGRNSPAARRAAAKATTGSRPSASAYTRVEKTPAGKPKPPRTSATTTPAKKAELRKERQAKTTMAVNASKVTGSKNTKGGEYKTYAKGSAAAKNFRSAFAAAKKAGKKTFTWDGKRYSTATK